MRSVAAVIAGLVTFAVALYAMQDAGTALMLRIYPDLPATATIVNQNNGTRVFWLVWETASMVAAGYVTARLAASSHVAHATVMGVIEAAVTLWAFFAVRSDEPVWFWLTGIAAMIPAAWFGGRWRSAGLRSPS